MSRVSPFRTFKNANGKDSEAVTQMMLRRRARQIATLEQFEDIVRKATHSERVRALLEPLLRPNLPCCLMAAKGEHTDGCPSLAVEMTRPELAVHLESD